jgi:hypothetical protein
MNRFLSRTLLAVISLGPKKVVLGIIFLILRRYPRMYEAGGEGFEHWKKFLADIVS